jgi:predicted site-specific integrase-resolvase
MKIILDGEEYIGQNDVLKLLKMKRYVLYSEIKLGNISYPLKPDERAFWKKKEIEEYLEKKAQK